MAALLQSSLYFFIKQTRANYKTNISGKYPSYRSLISNILFYIAVNVRSCKGPITEIHPIVYRNCTCALRSDSTVDNCVKLFSPMVSGWAGGGK